MKICDKRIILIFLSLLLAVGLCGCKKSNDTGQVQKEYKVEAEVKVGEDLYEVRVGSGNKLYEYLNGEKVKEVFGEAYNGKVLLALPDTANKSDGVINANNEIAHSTYSSSLKQSAYYMNFILNDGYKEEFKATTYKFIEYILSNGEQWKRVIITQDYIIVYDEPIGEIPKVNVTDYIFD